MDDAASNDWKYPKAFAAYDDPTASAYEETHCRFVVREIESSVENEDTGLALSRALQGERLADLLLHRAPVVLGCRSMTEFLAGCGLTPPRASEVLKFAKGTTKAEGVHFGWSRSLLGIDLAKLVGCATITELSRLPLTYRDASGEDVEVRFLRGTPTRVLETVLSQLLAKENEGPEVEASEAARRRERRIRGIVARRRAEDPVLERLDVRVTFTSGEARVHSEPLVKPEDFRSFGRLCEELGKVR